MVEDFGFDALVKGAVWGGRYRILRGIKAGGMGAVYEVLDERTDTRRALKVMLPGVVSDPDMRARFAAEARVTGGIDSDHIVRVVDAGIDSGTALPFLVMELLRGEDLASRLKKRGALSRAEVVTYLYQAVLALEKAHRAGIVHRDLKPDNLFLTTRDDGSPCIKILDFGIAKVLAGSQQSLGTKSMGTPAYMAPEQARGAALIGPSADLYSLGHIAYALLTGEAYWTEELRKATALVPFFELINRGLVERASARAARRGVSLTTAFDAWFLRSTSVRPADRFDSAMEAVAALAVALSTPLPRPSLPDTEGPSVREGPLGDESTVPAPVDSPSETVPADERALAATERASGSSDTIERPSPRGVLASADGATLPSPVARDRGDKRAAEASVAVETPSMAELAASRTARSVGIKRPVSSRLGIGLAVLAGAAAVLVLTLRGPLGARPEVLGEGHALRGVASALAPLVDSARSLGSPEASHVAEGAHVEVPSPIESGAGSRVLAAPPLASSARRPAPPRPVPAETAKPTGVDAPPAPAAPGSASPAPSSSAREEPRKAGQHGFF